MIAVHPSREVGLVFQLKLNVQEILLPRVLNSMYKIHRAHRQRELDVFQGAD